MTELKAFNWNAVVVGKWNPAILTPKGVAKEIFEKDENEPIDVLVPLDAMSPYKVRIDDLFISADFERLIIDCEKNDWKSLEKAMKYSHKAIDALPKTPLTAAGFNVRYELLEDPEESFFELLEIPLDNLFSDKGLQINRREVRRSLQWEDGLINLH
ncbi:MAG: hypothetical protein PVG39_23785, partial [Desulfobacteraceae bacterium]